MEPETQSPQFSTELKIIVIKKKIYAGHLDIGLNKDNFLVLDYSET